MENFFNKNVVLVGGSKGVFHELACELVRERANIVAIHNDKKELLELEDLIGNMRGNVHTYHCDITSRKDVEKVVTQLIRQHDYVDMIINGVTSNTENAFIDSKITDIEKYLVKDLFGGVRLVRLLLPHLLERNEGYLVHFMQHVSDHVDVVLGNLGSQSLKAFSDGLNTYFHSAGKKEIRSLFLEQKGKKSSASDVAKKIIVALKKNKLQITV